jgi:methyl-accepting chemotaxis protein
VTDIMAEISSASQEQSAGIEQVNRAIGQMDEATRQNASLVEQAGSSAFALQEEADKLAGLVSIFKLNGSGAATRRPAAGTALALRPAASRAGAEPEFEAF